jgi:hypothetical protein
MVAYRDNLRQKYLTALLQVTTKHQTYIFSSHTLTDRNKERLSDLIVSYKTNTYRQ